MCAFLCLPQIAPQTWIIILRRTMTATLRSRKPVMTQFKARSVPEYTYIMYTQENLTCGSCIIVKMLGIFSAFYFYKYYFGFFFSFVCVCCRIFMMKMMRSGSPKKPGGKWSEPPPWPELVASFFPPHRVLCSPIIDYENNSRAVFAVVQAFKRKRALCSICSSH